MRAADELRSFLAGRLGMADLDHELDIFAAGLMSSLLAMELVAHIETAYGCRLEPEDLAPENFVSVRAMALLIDRKQNNAAR